MDLPHISPREASTHKGTYGRVLIVAGSPGMPGAAILAARAAMRTGSGLVTLAIPGAVSSAAGAAVPEATQVLLPDHRADAVGPKMTGKFDSVAMGPGLGTSDGSRDLVKAALSLYEGPIVIDADALNVVALYPETAGAPSPRRVWTPHPGEFQRLTGEKPVGDANRIAACGRFVQRFGGVVVLKGHRTVVVEGDRAYLNETGNPGMATGGSGDVLTGMIASLLGQGFAPFDAARLGVHLHGSAGDIAAASLGEVSLIASDIVDHIPAAILKHQQRPS